MEYKFEISNSFPAEFKIILSYLGQQKHYQEIGSDKQEVKFSEGVVTALRKTKVINYTTDLEKIDYMLGYENKDFSFVVNDTHKYHAKVYVNDKSPNVKDRMEGSIILFGRIVFEYSKPEAKEYLIKSAWEWYHTYNEFTVSSGEVGIYINSERGYFKRIAERPKRSLDTIYLPNSEKQEIVNKIETFLKPETQKLYSRLGKAYKLVIALHGLPGTGKTSFIHSLASKFDHSISIYFNNMKIEDTDVPNLLQEIRSKSFLVFEDADALFNPREDTKNKGMSFSTILNVLDGFASPVNPKNPLIIFVTTNCLHEMDKTMIRPGRIDHFMEFKEMRNKEIKTMMKNFCGDLYTEEIGEGFCQELKNKRYKVTPSLLELHFFKYMSDMEKMISEIDEIGELKHIVESKKKDLYT